MSVKYELTTKYGDRYLIHANGDIQRTDMVHVPSGRWKLLGLHHVHRNLMFGFEALDHFLMEKLPLIYKNGNPQWTVVDYDHGTQRMWGNTRYHGIASIRRLDK